MLITLVFNSLKILKQLGWIYIKSVKQVGIKSLNQVFKGENFIEN
jgi:hypothetical protein